MKDAAAYLNIKGHFCGMGGSKRLLYAPADIEGHLGTVCLIDLFVSLID